MVAQLSRPYLKAGLGRAVVRLASYGLFEGRPLTTRGQWLNPLVFGLSSWLSRRGPLGRVRQPVFIVGTGRSGTTLLGTILSLHRDVGYLNEPKALWHRVHEGEDIIGSYSASPGSYCLTEDDATDAVCERFERLYGGYLRLVRRTRVVDKYPEAIFRLGFIRRIFPDARFIWLLRDGYSAIASVDRWTREFSRGNDTWWGRQDRKWIALVEQVCRHDDELSGHEEHLLSLDSDVDRAAIEWSVSFRRGATEKAAISDDIMLLRYEELVANPLVQMRNVVSFCDLDEDQRMLDYAQDQVRAGRATEKLILDPLVRKHFEGSMRAAGYG